jgi:hypothetical protein
MILANDIQIISRDVPYSRLQGGRGAPSGPFRGDIQLLIRDEEPSRPTMPYKGLVV